MQWPILIKLLSFLGAEVQTLPCDAPHNAKSHSKAHRGGDEEPTLPAGGQAQARAKRVEGVAPIGFAGGGGDASPRNRGARRGDNEGESMKTAWHQKIMIHAGIDTHSEILTTYDILKNTSPGRTAIVLPSPEALFPLLSFAIDRIEAPYNISLGYPLSRTSVFDLINHVLNAQARKQKPDQYPTAEYLSIMLHPFIKNLVIEENIRPILGTLERIFSEDVLENTVASKPFVTLAEIEAILFKEGIDASFKRIHEVFFQHFEKINTLY